MIFAPCCLCSCCLKIVVMTTVVDTQITDFSYKNLICVFLFSSCGVAPLCLFLNTFPNSPLPHLQKLTRNSCHQSMICTGTNLNTFSLRSIGKTVKLTGKPISSQKNSNRSIPSMICDPTRVGFHHCVGLTSVVIARWGVRSSYKSCRPYVATELVTLFYYTHDGQDEVIGNAY